MNTLLCLLCDTLRLADWLSAFLQYRVWKGQFEALRCKSQQFKITRSVIEIARFETSDLEGLRPVFRKRGSGRFASRETVSLESLDTILTLFRSVSQKIFDNVPDQKGLEVCYCLWRCHPDPRLGPILGPSRSHPGSEGVPSRFTMCFFLQYFDPIQVPRWGPSWPVLVPSWSRAFLPGSAWTGRKRLLGHFRPDTVTGAARFA